MKVDQVPDATKDMMELYKVVYNVGGDFQRVLPEIETFLQKYPYYPEALVFKARSLTALGRDDEALTCLKMATRADGFRLVGSFDEADVYSYRRIKEDAITAYCEAIKDHAIELQNGIDSCLMCHLPESTAKVAQLTKKAVIDFLRSGDANSFQTLVQDLLEMKDEIKVD